MTRTSYILGLLFSCVFAQGGLTQSNSVGTGLEQFVPEHIWIHTDRQLYVSGETIWFKIYNFDTEKQRLSNFSKVAYLEMINQQGSAISRIKLGLKDGTGQGSIDLPEALPNGRYRLRAYTRAMRNLGESAFTSLSLTVLRPGQAIAKTPDDKPQASSSTRSQPPNSPVANRQDLQIHITPSATDFSQRSQGAFDIITTDANGAPIAAQVSVSIALPRLQENPIQHAIPTSQVPTNTATFLAESDGMVLEGKVISQQSQQAAVKADVYLAFPGKTALVYGAQTDELGRFSFLLPDLYSLRQLVIQANPRDEIPVTIALEEEFHPTHINDTSEFSIPLAWEEMAKTALINAQVGKAYKAFEIAPTYTAPSPFLDIPFFGKPDAQYFLDDYTRFPLPEFFFEIVPEVAVRGKFGQERLEIQNDWNSPNNKLGPLLLVDGVPIFDQRSYLKLNNKLIESAEIVSAPFWLNPYYYQGVIQISSFEHQAYSFVTPASALQRSYLTLLPERNFLVPDYETQSDNPLPDFRNTLYWNAKVQTDADGKAQLHFTTSDAIGAYEIQVFGVSEKGKKGSASMVINVAKAIE
ncbi:MAG: hypothetical protein KTR30_06540 [Saprospiraceae bacterium]|nr:hypothetical protein [Saprospiraceae bacterium]